jgi:hypothetical protein
MDLFELALYFYLAVGSIKAMLIVVDLPTAAGVMSRLSGRSYWASLLLLAPMAVLVAYAMWPKALRSEGYRFFLAYRRFSVIKGTLQAYRSLAAAKAEAPEQ